MVFATHVLSKSTLTPRDRELVILRIGARCHSQYEFSQHAIIARRSDITDEEIEATKAAIDAHPWSDQGRRAAARRRRAARRRPDLRRDVGDADRASCPPSRCSTSIFAVGKYNLVSMVLNSAGVQLDEGVPAAL